VIDAGMVERGGVFKICESEEEEIVYFIHQPLSVKVTMAKSVYVRSRVRVYLQNILIWSYILKRVI